MLNKLLSKTALFLCLYGVSSFGYTADIYVEDPNSAVSPDVVTSFEGVLALTQTGSSNQGLTLTQRRDASSFVSSNWSDSTLNLSGLDLRGSLTGYLYQVLINDVNFSSGKLELGTGSTSSVPNLPLILDLGKSDLTVSAGSLELQGAHVVSTVNSFASDDGAVMNGVDSLDVNAGSTGQIISQQLIELGGGQANVKLLLDLNSTLKNGATFDVIQESRAPVTGESDITFSAVDSTNSVLFDTSYVINSSAAVSGTGQQSIKVTFSRDNNEYITKSFTDNHPSNNAALALGTIAAKGYALGDMQTVLTRLDLNDFGYGNNAKNLATQVKRLAPIANNSFVISSLGSVNLTESIVDYRSTARRGNWTGSDAFDSSVWLRGVSSAIKSSGSVPKATATAQDNAGYDGFSATSTGLVIGADKTFKRGMFGVSQASITNRLVQQDDRDGEKSTEVQWVSSVYGQVNDRNTFLSGAFTHSQSNIVGNRKTAIDRVASYDIPVTANQMHFKLGHRFDLPDGRTALTPSFRLAKSTYIQKQYVETGAGDLNLDVSKLEADRLTAELGVSVSHKGRFNSAKALTVLNLAIGNDFDVSDLTIHAKYTGDTNTQHSNETTFTTPSEAWANNFVKLGLDFQLELEKGVMLKMGLDGEMRQSRQNYAGELSLVWAF